MKKIVSVIIPAYNCEKTIERTVNSIKSSSYNNIEIIVKNISKGYNRNMKTVPIFIKQPRK